MVYEVYENGKLAGYPYYDIDPSWTQPKLSTFEEAQAYTKSWLGSYNSLCPTKPNQIVDYSGCGDIIEIRST